jgi:hypothetical protein
MPSKSRPVTTSKPIHDRPRVKRSPRVTRFFKSHFTRDVIVILAVAGYIVGLCYLASFLLAHPLLLAMVIIAVASLAVSWCAGGAK